MKFAVIFLLALSTLAACQKSDLQPASTEVTGQLKYGGDPAAGGLGYYMLTDSTHEKLSVQNLPAEFKHTDVNAHVGVRVFYTGKKMSLEMLPGAVGPRIIVIRS